MGVDAQARAGSALRIEVDDEDPAPALGQSRPEIDGGGRLADPALLIAHGDDACGAM